MVRRSREMTPCGAMFDVLKRVGGISHKDLAALILSERPLADGRTPLSRAADRTWVSRFIVHAPADLVHQRYFCAFDVAANRIFDRLHAPRAGNMSCAEILDMICGESGLKMVRALDAIGQDTRLYRNALLRLRDGNGSEGDRASAALGLFVAAGCSADVGAAVEFAMMYVRDALGGKMATPTPQSVARDFMVDRGDEGQAHSLGLVRIVDGCVGSNPYWIDPASGGVEIGALATGARDIADVEGDVSARHARVWFEAPDDSDDGDRPAGSGRWLLRDLGSSHGTFVVRGDDGSEMSLASERDVEIRPGDEIRLASETVFVVVEGTAEMVRKVARLAGA